MTQEGFPCLNLTAFFLFSADEMFKRESPTYCTADWKDIDYPRLPLEVSELRSCLGGRLAVHI
jgi:hypothetical protein